MLCVAASTLCRLPVPLASRTRRVRRCATSSLRCARATPVLSFTDRSTCSCRHGRRLPVKAALDHAAIEHGTAEAKSLKQGTLQQRRVAKAHEFYNQLLDAAGGAQHPVPGGFARYAADPEANLRQFVDQKAIDENLGAVQNDPTFSLHPQVNGHQVVGPVTPEEWWARTQHAVGGDQELGRSSRTGTTNWGRCSRSSSGRRAADHPRLRRQPGERQPCRWAAGCAAAARQDHQRRGDQAG